MRRASHCQSTRSRRYKDDGRSKQLLRILSRYAEIPENTEPLRPCGVVDRLLDGDDPALPAMASAGTTLGPGPLRVPGGELSGDVGLVGLPLPSAARSGDGVFELRRLLRLSGDGVFDERLTRRLGDACAIFSFLAFVSFSYCAFILCLLPRWTA